MSLSAPTHSAASGAAGPGLPGAASGVAFQDVGRRFGHHAVIDGIDLTAAPGEVIAVLGPSGCGKSTLLRLAAGLDQPTSGRVVIGQSPVRPWDPRCAVAFQEPRLLPWRTLRQNVALGLPRSPGRSRRDGARGTDAARIDELLDLVGLADFTGHRPREVSGGMAQRASLARALARDPEVLLLDEPFGALDALTRLTMQDLLLSVHAASPATILLVTHDVDEALQLADRVVLLGPAPDDDAGRPAGRGGRGPAVVRAVHRVPGARPRDRGSADLARMRADLFAGLGVDPH